MTTKNDNSHAICTSPLFGPTFGSGYDLQIGSNNDLRMGKAYIGNTYQRPHWMSDSFFLSGNKEDPSSFTASEIEVFQV